MSGVERLMNNHQGHKTEIDASEDNFGDLYSFGKEPLSMSHYASNAIQEKLKERWKHLQLILEVYQFAWDAAVAEAWLIAQDPYFKSDEFGQSIDERKLSGMERDLAAVQAKLDAMEEVSEKIAMSHPRGC